MRDEDNPPLEVSAMGEAAVEAWRRSLETASQSLDEVKLVLVGQGAAGKTSLVHRLRGEGFDEALPTTHGIEVSSLFALVENREIRVNVWDFGGQEIMYSTHQFFLSRRSIYVIVLDARQEVRPEYWLETISAFGGDSPVLIVVNKIDQNPSFDLNEPRLREMFTNIIGIHRLSCLSGHGLDEFRQALKGPIGESSMLKEKLPASWLRVRNVVQEATSDYLDLDEFTDLCIDAGIKDTNSQEVLLGYLHDLGVVNYFPEVALQVLNPNWLTHAIYSIINSKTVIEAHGILDHVVIKDLLSREHGRHAYPANERRAVLEIMKRFELCYDLPDKKVLIPVLLSPREPEFDFISRGCLRICFDYGFLPASVIPRFLVRMHDYIEPGLIWRSGAVLRASDASARAILRGDSQSQTIEVLIDGEKAWELLGLIRQNLENINKDFSGLAVTERIPCRCSYCVGSRNPHLYSRKRLIEKLEQGFHLVECERSEEAISLSQLLPGHPLVAAQLIEAHSEFAPLFVSYSSLDSEETLSVIEDLRKLRIPFWFDQEQINPGDSISQALSEALSNCSILVACISKNQIKSGWARAEYGSALASFLSEGNKRVIPLILDNTTKEEIPSILRDLRSVHRNNSAEYGRFLRKLADEICTADSPNKRMEGHG